MEELCTWPWVEARVDEAIAVWNDCATKTAQMGPQYARKEQRKRERSYDEGLYAVEREAKRIGRGTTDRLDAQKRIVAVFPPFAAIALGLDAEAIGLLTDYFLPAGTQLALWARRFDANLSIADTIQACRNAWTACGLQPLMGDPIRMTPSILGYSLLYPYSDNYLDRVGISTREKIDFSRRFRDRLSDVRISARNRHEASVWALVGLIEEQYARSRYPQVFDSLLAIHRAQEDSIGQLNGQACDASEMLRITFAKGGTSVLTDACLSHGWLNREESRFAFNWGILLQLGDDLQDLHDDMRRGSMTLFTRAAAMHVPLDGLVTQLLNLSDHVAEQMDRLPNGRPVLKDLLRMSWRSLILMAVAGAQEFFSPLFLAELERSSPFAFNFQRARQRKLTGRQALYAIIFDAFMEACEVDRSGLPLPDSRVEACLEADSGCFRCAVTLDNAIA